MEPSDAFFDLVLHKLQESRAADGLDEERVAYAIAPQLFRFHGYVSDELWEDMLRDLVDVCARYDEFDLADPAALGPQPPSGYGSLEPDPSGGTRPPPCEPTPLVSSEIEWLLGWAKDRAHDLSGDHEESLACCAASILPFFKTGKIRKQETVSIPRYELERAATSAWPARHWGPDETVKILGMLRVVHRAGVFAEGPRAASYALTLDVPFTTNVPELEEPGPKLNPHARYRALCAISLGQDWRPLLGPLQKAGLRHLSADELSQIVERFDVAPGEVAFGAIELGVFCAQLMPRIKHAHAIGQPYALLTHEQIEECLVRRQPFQTTLDACKMFEHVPGWVNPFVAPHVGLRLRDGAFTFSNDAPAKPLCLRSGDQERRWESIKLAAKGLNGRAV